MPGWLFGSEYNVNPTTAAFIGLAALLCSGVLSWDDVLKNKGAWDTVVWFAALVMMASFLGKLGLIKWVSLTVGGGIDHLGIGWTGGMLLLVLFYVYSHYFLPAPQRISPPCSRHFMQPDWHSAHHRCCSG